MMQTAALSENKRKFLDALLRGQSAKSQGIDPRPNTEVARLGLSQEEVVNRSIRTHDDPPLYNETVTVYREGPLDVRVLERCFTEIIRRHEVWRTSFQQGLQIVHPAEPQKIALTDLRDLPEEWRATEVARVLGEMAQEPFDLAHGPLTRARLFRMGDYSYRFVVAAHQSIIDGVSIYQVLPSELAALYDAFSSDQPSPLPELTLQYADFASWQRKQDTEKQKTFWKEKLDSISRPNDKLESYRGVIRPFVVPQHLNSAIRDLTHREGVTLFMTLLAAFATLLHRYSAQSDILVGTLSPAGRKRVETQKLMGYFLNPVALRFNFAKRPTFHDLLAQTRGLIAEAISNDDVPIEEVARELGISAPDPFVKIAMSLQPQVPRSLSQWNVTSMDAQNGGSVWDLYLAFIESRAGLIGRVQFNPDVFEEHTINSTLDDLWRVLAEVAKQ